MSELATLEVKPAFVESDDGKAFAPLFDDIYATRSGAFGQANSVFLSEGEIAHRWRGRDSFTILENGFGLGTNFLATLKAWRNDPSRSQFLHYVALECFPVSSKELERFCAEQLTAEARELAKLWPPCLPGYHHLSFDRGSVRLTLIFGDSASLSRKLLLHYDALFLDGFSPDKNPRMWTEGLLRDLARYAKEGATVTTWCTKGEVRRALSRAGFMLEKKPGFGKKRERLFGVMQAKRTKYVQPKFKEVVVIGAGLAGANVAYSLALKGVRVRVVDEAPIPGGAASALAWGILHPHFTRDDSPLSKLSREGFLFTRRRLLDVEKQTQERIFASLGCLQMAHTDEIFKGWEQAREQSLPFRLPEDYGKLLDCQEASEVVGYGLKRGGWYFPMAGMVRCGAFCRALIQTARVPYRGNTRVTALRKSSKGWQLIGKFGEVIDEASDVVVCCALDSARLLSERYLGLEPLPGRITLLRDTDLSALQCPVSGEGYIAHMTDGYCGVGATYELKRNGPWTEYKAHEDNLAKIDRLLANPPEVVVTGAYCGVRVAGPGRLPLIGRAIDETKWIDIYQSARARLEDLEKAEISGLWVLTGLGSRGLSMASLCSEMLVSTMMGLPMPTDPALLKTTAVGRYLRRSFLARK